MLFNHPWVLGGSRNGHSQRPSVHYRSPVLGGRRVTEAQVTLKEVEKDQNDGSEERRAASRQDSRPKIGLFPIKRLGGIHLWLLKLFENPVEHLVRVERMKQLPVTMGIITDTSLKGWTRRTGVCFTWSKPWKRSSLKPRQRSWRWSSARRHLRRSWRPMPSWEPWTCGDQRWGHERCSSAPTQWLHWGWQRSCPHPTRPWTSWRQRSYWDRAALGEVRDSEGGASPP